MKIQTKAISVLRTLLFTSVCSLLLVNVQAQTTVTVVVAADTVATVEVESQGIDTLTTTSVEEVVQPFCRHEFSIWTSLGASTLHYRPTTGIRETGFGGAFGLGYTYFFHPNWGIRTGLEIAVYNTTFRLNRLRDMYTRYGFDDLTPGWSGTDEIIDYHTEVSNYRERQRLYNLNIPLLLQFQTPLAGGNHQFFASAGVRLGLPIHSTFEVRNATLYTWHFDHRFNQEFRPDPIDYGPVFFEDLGLFYNLSFSTRRLENRVRISGMASAEAGVKFHLNPRHSLYVGAFVDYGFNNIRRHSGNRFFEFDPINAEMVSNSILSSQYTSGNRPTANFTNRVVPLSFGLTVRMGINMCPMPRHQRASRRAAAPLPPMIFNINVTCECSCSRTSCCCCEAREQQQPAGQNNAPSPATERPHPRVCTWMEDAERERAQREYGELVDLVILPLSGYDINQSKLTPIMRRILDHKIQYLQRYNSPEYIIICEGHTCNLGSMDVNMRLGRQRAEVVRGYLIESGFNPQNIRVVSRGPTVPIIENADEAHRRINRRVVFLIQRVGQD